jgi:2,3-bisphosphoglycerate-independent phosphoglycerate mutase
LSTVLAKNTIPSVKISLNSKADSVGYYFNGRRKETLEGEKIMSVTAELDKGSDDYEMSAGFITKIVINQMMDKHRGFILANLSNVDHFAHTRNIVKTSRAVRNLDQYLRVISDAALRANTVLIITSDHGMAESMGSSDKIVSIGEHSKNPVPLIIVSKTTQKAAAFNEHSRKLNNLMLARNSLCDIAPTILDIFGIEKPKEFTGQSLLNNYEAL